MMNHTRLRAPPRENRQRGVAYIGVLLLVAAVGIGMTQAVKVWEKIRLREQEAELMFVGDQIAQAIESYFKSAGGSRYPMSFDDLVNDTRVPSPLRHLRRAYRDPLDSSRDWGIIRSTDGGMMGVFSEASGRPLKQQGFPSAYERFSGKTSYRQWSFGYFPTTTPAGNVAVEAQ